MGSNHSFSSLPTIAVINQNFAPALSWPFRHLQNSVTTAHSAHDRNGCFFSAYSLPTVVQVTTEAGVGFYFRCAGCTALRMTDCLCESRRNT